MAIFAGNEVPHCSHVFSCVRRGTLLRGPASGRCGRHVRQCLRPRKSSRLPSMTTVFVNGVPQARQIVHDRTLVLSWSRVKGRPAPAGGFEPPTKGLTVLCTAVVLRR